jgi:hypothetical protein
MCGFSRALMRGFVEFLKVDFSSLVSGVHEKTDRYGVGSLVQFRVIMATTPMTGMVRHLIQGPPCCSLPEL